VLFDFIRDTYKRIDSGVLNRAEAALALVFLKSGDRILDVLAPESAGGVDESLVEKLIEERKQARGRKDFKRADEIRRQFDQMGVVLEDTPAGTRWKLRV
jgi:cysteinyl-tRNA synthetase